MTISSQTTKELERRIQEANSDQVLYSQNSLQVAKLELAFLLSKDSVSFRSENLILERKCSSTAIYTLVQEYFVQILICFLTRCPHYQALPKACQTRLLKKNMTDVSILLLLMSYEKTKQVFRWSYKTTNVEIDEETLSRHLGGDMGLQVFKAVSSLAELDIPGHLIILLLLVFTFSRDGVAMENQDQIDTARDYYRKLMFFYLKETNPDGSHINIIVHRVLKTVRDFGENFRSQVLKSKDT